MAINPETTNTVRVDELPLSPITTNSIIAHSKDGILYQGTVSEIIALIPSLTYKPYQVLWLNVTDLYVTNNFEPNGLGKTDGLWNGWQIMNGQNGTEDFDGCVPVGYGDEFSTMRQELGENSKNFNIPVNGYGVGEATDAGQSGRLIVSSGQPEAGEFLDSVKKVNNVSPSITFNNMQKGIVQLFIMKLP